VFLLSKRTVEGHRQQLINKTETKNTADIVLLRNSAIPLCYWATRDFYLILESPFIYYFWLTEYVYQGLSFCLPVKSSLMLARVDLSYSITSNTFDTPVSNHRL